MRWVPVSAVPSISTMPEQIVLMFPSETAAPPSSGINRAGRLARPIGGGLGIARHVGEAETFGIETDITRGKERRARGHHDVIRLIDRRRGID